MLACVHGFAFAGQRLIRAAVKGALRDDLATASGPSPGLSMAVEEPVDAVDALSRLMAAIAQGCARQFYLIAQVFGAPLKGPPKGGSSKAVLRLMRSLVADLVLDATPDLHAALASGPQLSLEAKATAILDPLARSAQLETQVKEVFKSRRPFVTFEEKYKSNGFDGGSTRQIVCMACCVSASPLEAS